MPPPWGRGRGAHGLEGLAAGSWGPGRASSTIALEGVGGDLALHEGRNKVGRLNAGTQRSD